MALDTSPIDINTLLFRSKNSKEVKPFDNIPDLGRVIASLPDSKHAGKAEIVTAFLRQVFNGTRPCPNEYLKAIVAATRLRAAERQVPENVDVLVGAIEKRIQGLKKGRERRIRDKHRFSPKLTRAFANSDVAFAVNPQPGEVPVGPTDNKRLSQIIAESLASIEEIDTPQTVYKLCYPTDTDAVDLWRMIFDELSGKYSRDVTPLEPEAAADTIAKAEVANQLQIYVIPYYLCLAAAIIYNPDNRDECAGIALQMEKAGQVKAYEIDERNIAYWRQMYYDLENGELGKYRRLSFSRYRNLVMRRPPAS